jgi:hypothetical protein
MDSHLYKPPTVNLDFVLGGTLNQTPLSILSRRSLRGSQEKNLVGDKKLALSLGGGFLNKKKIERILNHN